MPRLPIFGWAAFTGAKHSDLPCILDAPQVAFTSSGQAAIALALRNLAIGARDRVLVPTYHCPSMIAPVAAAGARPLFFAIDSTGAPAIDAIEGLDLSGVRAMIATHYFGFPQPMARVRHFCDLHGISLIEDCAHAMFGRSEESVLGAAGDYAVASLTKFFPVTDGGCLASYTRQINSESLRRRTVAEEIKSAANALEIGASHGAMPGIGRVLHGVFATANAIRAKRRPPHASGSTHADASRNAAGGSRAVNAESAGRRGASAWSRWIAHSAARGRIVAMRRRNYQQLAALLSDVPGTRVLWPKLPESVVPYVFPLWVASPENCYERVRASGVPLFRWDDVWPGTPAMPGDVGPDWSLRIFQLACHQDLGLDDLGFIADTIKRTVGRTGS